MNKLKKLLKILTIVTIISSVSASFIACGDESKDTSKDTSKEVTTQVESSIKAEDIAEPFADAPVLVTSAGQSADFDIAMTLMEKAEITFNSNGVLKAEELADNKTLVIAVGGSSKGLGAAGIDINDELSRIEDVITQAKNDGLNIIALHTGGEGRRGDLSDKFVNAVMPHADYILIVSTGDSDGLITEMALENSIPMGSVDTIAEVIGSLQKAFK